MRLKTRFSRVLPLRRLSCVKHVLSAFKRHLRMLGALDCYTNARLGGMTCQLAQLSRCLFVHNTPDKGARTDYNSRGKRTH
jgi:hypothetical protein